MATVKHEGKDSPLKRNIYSPRDGLASPLSPNLIRIAGGVEAVGWDYSVEPEKGRLQLERMRPAFKDCVLADSKDASFHSCLRPVAADDVAIIGQTGQVK